jgi:hypothetical protein
MIRDRPSERPRTALRFANASFPRKPHSVLHKSELAERSLAIPASDWLCTLAMRSRLGLVVDADAVSRGILRLTGARRAIYVPADCALGTIALSDTT